MINKEFRKISGKVYCTVYTDQEKSVISDTWNGEFDSIEKFEEVLIYIAEQIEEFKVKGWLADLRDLQGSFDKSSDWLSTYLMPRVISSGLKAEAIVVPKDVYARLSTKDTIQKVKDFELKQFDNLFLAEEWLTSKI